MNFRASLRTQLLLALTACLVVVILVQLATRKFVELPELYAQEYSNDVGTVEQVKRVLSGTVAHIRERVVDLAHWDDSYNFMKLDPAHPDYAAYVTREFFYTESMHYLPRINGYMYFTPTGRLHFESTYDLVTGAKAEPLPLSLSAFMPLPADDYAATRGGFLPSPDGPVLFVIASVTDDDTSLEPSGYLVMWRKLDAAFFNEVLGPLDIQFENYDVSSEPDLVASILENSNGVLPRDRDGFTSWLIESVDQQPLMLIRQAAPSRLFKDSLISASSMLGISASALLLLMFALFLSRRVIRPIVEFSGFMQRITENEDFSRRINSPRVDEFGMVGQRLNKLLERVEKQELALKSQNASLAELADRDSLTGLYNRRGLDRVLAQDWSVAMRSKRVISGIMLDVDCFKGYNDHYGHQAGDDVLRLVARSLAANVQRATDCVCRYGGEEFFVLLMDTSNADALKIAERMVHDIQALEIQHERSDCAKVITISAGVATATPRNGQSQEDFIRRIDEGLYKAKEAGRNTTVNAGELGIDVERRVRPAPVRKRR